MLKHLKVAPTLALARGQLLEKSGAMAPVDSPLIQILEIYIGESFQDYSWIQDFEANFPRKSASKCWIGPILIASLFSFQLI